MADGTDQTVALDFKPTQPAPDVVGAINSLSQLQYYAALGKKTEAETSGIQAKNSANLEAYSRAQNGEKAENLGPALSIYNDTGATAMMANAKAGLDLQAQRQYATANPRNPLAIGGPPMVQQGAAAESSLADVDIKHAQLRAQAASSILAAAGPDGKTQIPPAVKSYWLDNLVRQGAISPARAQELSNHSDAELIALAKGIQSQGMTPPEAAEASGTTTFHKGEATAATGLHIKGPADSVVGGAAGVAAASRTPGDRDAVTLPAASQSQSIANQAASAMPGSRQPDQPQGLNYFGQTIKRESGGNPSAVNKTTGAMGLGQFIPSTARDLMQKHPELGLTMSDFTDSSPAGVQKQLSALRAFTADNAAVLSNAGVAVNDKNLYLAHFMGANGAAQFLKAGAQNPNAPGAQIFPAEARANPSIFYSNGQPRTLGQVYNVLTNGHGSNLSIDVPPGEGAVNMVAGAGSPQIPNGLQSPAAALLETRNATAQSPVGSPLGLRAAANVPLQAPSVGQAVTASATPPALTPQLLPQAVGRSSSANPNVLSPAAIAPNTGAQASNPNVLVPGMSLADVAAERTRGEASARIQAEQFQEAQRGYRDAQNAQLSLQQLQKSLSDVKDSNGLTNFFLAPGSGATERAGWAKEINTRLSQIGMAPMIAPDKIAAAEEAQKITGRLGFDTSRTLGSREAASIVQEAIHLNPGLENTPQGAKVVAASINAAAQRQKDFYAFLSDSGNKAGSDIAFDRAHPVSQYAREAQILAAIPQGAVDLLQRHANDPRAAALFDRQYGPGMARYYVGGEQ